MSSFNFNLNYISYIIDLAKNTILKYILTQNKAYIIKNINPCQKN